MSIARRLLSSVTGVGRVSQVGLLRVASALRAQARHDRENAIAHRERLQSALERLVVTVHVFGERQVLDGASRCVYKTLAEAKEYCTAFGMNLFDIAQWHGQVARVL
jgi:hypothetical protein